MSTLRLKEKISQLVSNQFPEYLRADYPTFVEFIEAYYRFLEQDQNSLELVQNALSYSDIDRTSPDFINYFLKNYANEYPLNHLTDKKLFVKRLNDLYQAKGSELSFKALFRILYNENVEIYRPYDTVLRPSDGIWEQRLSIIVETLDGDRSNITDRFITLSKNGITYTDDIVRVKFLTATLTELFLKITSIAPYEVNDTINIKDGNDNILFVGIIRPTATGYSITQPGTGFKVGQIFNVSTAGAVDTLVRIISVTPNGGIDNLQIINYGYNYPNNNITITLRSGDLFVAQRVVDPIFTTTGGFSESIILASPHVITNPSRYFLTDYVDNDEYTGVLLTSNSSIQATVAEDLGGSADLNLAVITFTVGTKAVYPGQYISSKGFISDPEIKLQDGGLYQPYGYQLKSNLDLKTYITTVKDLVHPAGSNLYSDRQIYNLLDGSNSNVFFRPAIDIELRDSFRVIDVATAALLKDLPTDYANTTDAISIITGKYFSNTLITIDEILKNVEPKVQDSASTSENISLTFTGLYNDNATPIESLTLFVDYNLLDSANAVENISLQTNRPLENSLISPIDELETFIWTRAVDADDTTSTDDSVNLIFTGSYTDNVSTQENIAKNLGLNINNVDSTVTLAESITAINTNYAEAGYFAEVYAGSVVINI